MLPHPPRTCSIVADIGGTNTRVALARGREVLADTVRKYRNSEYPGLEPVLARYVADEGGVAPLACCVAVAGPVRGGSAIMTNINWAMTEASVAAATGAARAVLVNDLQAQGHALGHIAPGMLRTVVDGPVEPGEPMLVVGLGTGVNAAPVHGQGAGRVVPPSECGHVSMPVRNARDLRLLAHVEALPSEPGRTRRCSVEEVLSGRGLGNLYGFELAEAGRPGAATSAEAFAALAGQDPLAAAAVRNYVRILAQFLGDLALVHLPYGGIFLIGGMARAIMPHLAENGFAEAFRAPRWVDVLDRSFRVTVVDNDDTALTGCAAYMAALLEHD